jgi:molybdenum cofactor synthesis domain-containing protein
MYKAGIITTSDRSSKGERKDLSGPEIEKWCGNNGFRVEAMEVVADEKEKIKEKLIDMSDSGFHLILTTGGTGFAPRDVTPEATSEVIERPAPGFTETMRYRSLEITDHAMLSRAVSGIRKRSLIINLPGSPKAVRENLSFIEKAIPHAMELLSDSVNDCGTE